NRGAIDVEASKLVRHPKVALRLDQFRESKTANAILTLEAHMSELQSLRDAARTAGQMSAAITAEVKRGELMRFYVKQVESAHVNKFSHMSDEELEAFIRRVVRRTRTRAPTGSSPLSRGTIRAARRPASTAASRKGLLARLRISGICKGRRWAIASPRPVCPAVMSNLQNFAMNSSSSPVVSPSSNRPGSSR